MDVAHALTGFLVGLLVGMTGVGGGSLMAPLLILIFGVAPTTAIGTDLWFAGTTKTVGGAIHSAKNNADLRIVGRLMIGSIPAAIATLVVMNAMHWDQVRSGWLPITLGLVLVATAVATIARPTIHRWVLARAKSEDGAAHGLQLPLTILTGALLGVLVTITSVGAGALGDEGVELGEVALHRGGDLGLAGDDLGLELDHQQIAIALEELPVGVSHRLEGRLPFVAVVGGAAEEVDHPPARRLVGRDEQVGLRGEEAEDVRLGDPCGLRDLDGGGGAVALRGEDRERGLDQRLAPLLGG